MKTHRTILSKCPVCGHLLDACTNVGDGTEGPKEDDASICIACTTILLYNADQSLREATEDEIGNMSHEVRQHLMNARRYFKNV